MSYLFGNRASSMGTFLFCLSAALEENGKEGSVASQCLGWAGSGAAESKALDYLIGPFPGLGLLSSPSMTPFGALSTSALYVEAPWAQRVHLPPSLIGLPLQHPRSSDSDLYPWKLMGQSGYYFFSIGKQ